MSNDKNSVWLATDQGLYNYTKSGFKRFFNGKQLALYQINTFTLDNTNNIWYGTYSGHLVKFNNGKILRIIDLKPICLNEDHLITSITINFEKNSTKPAMLITTSGGEIFTYDTAKNIARRLKSPADGTLYVVKHGYSPIIWLGASNGFFTKKRRARWKKKKGLYSIYSLIENKDNYWAIGRDQNQKAVLMLYYNDSDKESKKRYLWKKFELEQLKNEYTRFYELGFTDNEMAWIISENGLIRYDLLDASVKLFNENDGKKLGSLRHIAVQNNNLLWISTSGKTLYKVDIK